MLVFCDGGIPSQKTSNTEKVYMPWRHNGHILPDKRQDNRAEIRENIKATRGWPCEGNSPVTYEFPAQKTSNAEKISIWWRHNVLPDKRPDNRGIS